MATLNVYSKEQIDTQMNRKQNTLVAGANITITGNTISAVGGSGISITDMTTYFQINY